MAPPFTLIRREALLASVSSGQTRQLREALDCLQHFVHYALLSWTASQTSILNLSYLV